MQILLENSTADTLIVHQFPKAEFMLDEDGYSYSEPGDGDYTTCIFDLRPEMDRVIYTTINIDQQPHRLALNVFDSILIQTTGDNSIRLMFTPDTVTGYPENLFDSASAWKYEKNEYSLKTNLSSSPIVSHDHSFVISAGMQ
jgi:hypothetical protein